MGCTPSIHVSQTGVVYCRESDDSNSPHPSTYNNTQGNYTFTGTTAQAVIGTKAGASGTQVAKTVARDQHTNHSVEAETQTSRGTMKGTDKDIGFGPMKIKQPTMSVLLVFGKEDAQSDGFWWAADRAGYQCNLVRNAESAMSSFLERHHDLVVIDHRSSKHFNAEALCGSIRATRLSEHTIIMAVTKKPSNEKEEPSILPLIQSGFNRRFLENHNVGVCMNELLLIEHSELRAQVQLRAALALQVAVEHSSDAVEVTNEDFEIEYVNPAYERLVGYTCDELQGRDSRELRKNDNSKTDLHESINVQLKKGKPWEGIYYTRRKDGECLTHHCKILPILGQSGKIRHLVKCVPVDNPHNLIIEKYGGKELDQVTSDLYYKVSSRKSSGDVRSVRSFSSDGGTNVYSRRRESVARIHSMTIEAPINKVINLISAVQAQESSPMTVVQALDKVLDILRTSELYSPYFSQQVKEDDQMTNDLIGGLMTMQSPREREDSINSAGTNRTQNMRRRFSSECSYTKPVHHVNRIPSSQSATLTQIPPELKKFLDSEPHWNFDVIELERLTAKRPLVYLGLQIFQRFGVLDFLQVSETQMVNWLQMVESHYHETNAYHNSTHAADVLHATAYFCERERIKSIFDETDVVCSLIASVIHDLDHPGKTNAFLVNSGSQLAMLYNDLAVLESHHVSLAFQLTQSNERANIFKNVERDDFRSMRQQIIDMVLATEMTKHFEHVNKFVSSITKQGAKSDEDISHISSTGDLRDNGAMSPVLTSPENRTLIKRMLIKCADVSNPARPLALCAEWATRISEEYFQQTDEEIANGYPVVMPVFDRKTCNVPKSQISFVDFFVHDMFEAWDAFVDVPEVMNHLQTNYRYWKDQEEKVSKDKVKKQPSANDES